VAGALVLGTVTPAPAPWLSSSTTTGSITVSWTSPPTSTPWTATWGEDRLGARRTGEIALPPTARSYTLTGLTPGRWVVYLDNTRAWPHTRVAVATVP
jgi:hypothetical protein